MAKPVKYQAGLSMIELMISMVIGLVIIGAVLQAFLSSNQTYRMQQAHARLQEDGRAALHFLTRDIRMADFWGCIPDDSMITSQLDTTSAEYDAAAHDFTTTNSITGTDGASDTLTLKSAADNGIGIQPPAMPNTAAALHVTANSGLQQYQIVLVSDCVSGDIFEITKDPTTGVGLNDQAVHNGGSVAQGPGNISASLSKPYGTDAKIFGLRSRTFSVADVDGEPTLLRDGQELVQNVENMQFLYGVDTDNDFSANYYVPASNVTDMDDVVSIRVSLLVRSTEDNLTTVAQTYNFNGATVTAADNRIRQVFTSTITVRNRVE